MWFLWFWLISTIVSFIIFESWGCILKAKLKEKYIVPNKKYLISEKINGFFRMLVFIAIPFINIVFDFIYLFMPIDKTVESTAKKSNYQKKTNQ
jgi:hypothetical protein